MYTVCVICGTDEWRLKWQISQHLSFCLSECSRGPVLNSEIGPSLDSVCTNTSSMGSGSACRSGGGGLQYEAGAADTCIE